MTREERNSLWSRIKSIDEETLGAPVSKGLRHRLRRSVKSIVSRNLVLVRHHVLEAQHRRQWDSVQRRPLVTNPH